MMVQLMLKQQIIMMEILNFGILMMLIAMMEMKLEKEITML